MIILLLFDVNALQPGSDCASETAAALCAAALLLEDDFPAYANQLVDHAEELFRWN